MLSSLEQMNCMKRQYSCFNLRKTRTDISHRKWASEKYLENAHIGSGLLVTIHRPSYVLGPDAPQLDVMHNILNFAERLKNVPRMPSVDRWLQFVGIDDVAQDIVTDVLDICNS